MENRIRPTRSGLFAIELLIAVGVFIFCAAVCMGLFAKAETISADSVNLNRAVNEAKSVAECFKAAGGDLEETAELCGGGIFREGGFFLKFDNEWNRLPDNQYPAFVLELFPQESDGYSEASLIVYSYGKDSEILVNWTVSALEVGE